MAIFLSNLTDDDIKDTMLLSLMDSPKKQERIDALLAKTWIVYSVPEFPYFFTSDNPVVRYNPVKKSFRNGDNGLKDSNSEIFFPLSPSILLRIVSPTRLNGVTRFDNSKISFPSSNDALDFVLYCNSFQKIQSYKHFFIPPALYHLLSAARKKEV